MSKLSQPVKVRGRPMRLGTSEADAKAEKCGKGKLY